MQFGTIPYCTLVLLKFLWKRLAPPVSSRSPVEGHVTAADRENGAFPSVQIIGRILFRLKRQLRSSKYVISIASSAHQFWGVAAVSLSFVVRLLLFVSKKKYNKWALGLLPSFSKTRYKKRCAAASKEERETVLFGEKERSCLSYTYKLLSIVSCSLPYIGILCECPIIHSLK